MAITETKTNLSQTHQNDPQKAQQYFKDKLSFTTGPVELNRMIEGETDMVIVDVRAREDYEKGHVPGAINLPRDRWSNVEKLDKNALNIVYCYSIVCHLGAEAALVFASKGYPVMELEGGFETWQEHDLKVEK